MKKVDLISSIFWLVMAMVYLYLYAVGKAEIDRVILCLIMSTVHRIAHKLGA